MSQPWFQWCENTPLQMTQYALVCVNSCWLLGCLVFFELVNFCREALIPGFFSSNWNEKQWWGLEQRSKGSSVYLAPWAVGTAAFLCCVLYFVLLAVPSSAPSALLSDRQPCELVLHWELLSEWAWSTSQGRQELHEVELEVHTSAQPGRAAWFRFCSLSSWVLPC